MGETSDSATKQEQAMRHVIAASLLIAVALGIGCNKQVESDEVELFPPEQPQGWTQSPDLTAAPPEPVVEPALAGTEPVAPPTDFEPPPAGTRVHVARAGDTLWKISGIYYGKSSRANVQKIVDANPEITDANFIRVGQKIVIPE